MGIDLRTELVWGGAAVVGGLAAGAILGAASVGPLGPVAALVFGSIVMAGAYAGRFVVQLTPLPSQARPFASLIGIITGIALVTLTAVGIGVTALSVPLVLFVLEVFLLAIALGFVAVLVAGVAATALGSLKSVVI